MPRTLTRRIARRRSFLMCPPEHFSVEYSINPWMDTARPVDPVLAGDQWQRLRDTLRALGHGVELAPAHPGLPDMVFAANAATVIEQRVLVASFRHHERAGESVQYERWFRDRGYQLVRRARHINEGEGDHLLAGGMILAGHGMRTERTSHCETSEYFGLPIIGLMLTDPRFYHLDTALAVLSSNEVMYYPGAFDAESRRRLRNLYPDAILADERDAEVFGLNAISDGLHVLLPAAATGLAARLAERGFEPVGVELDELLKAGGGPKCCVLQLRGQRPAVNGHSVPARGERHVQHT